MESPAEPQAKSPAPCIPRISAVSGMENAINGIFLAVVSTELLWRSWAGILAKVIGIELQVCEICIDHPNGQYDIQPFARLSGTSAIHKTFDIIS